MSIAVHKNDSIKHLSSKQHTKQHSNIVYYLLSIVALALMFEGVWLAYPPIYAGINHLPEYANLTWAHDSLLVETFLKMLGMIWLGGSSLFWGGWLIKRSYRKIKGRHWRIHVNGKNRIAAFFPPVLSYLKFSCYYLIIVLLFVILQYPLQFIVFA